MEPRATGNRSRTDATGGGADDCAAARRRWVFLKEKRAIPQLSELELMMAKARCFRSVDCVGSRGLRDLQPRELPALGGQLREQGVCRAERQSLEQVCSTPLAVLASADEVLRLKLTGVGQFFQSLPRHRSHRAHRRSCSTIGEVRFGASAEKNLMAKKKAKEGEADRWPNNRGRIPRTEIGRASALRARLALSLISRPHSAHLMRAIMSPLLNFVSLGFVAGGLNIARCTSIRPAGKNDPSPCCERWSEATYENSRTVPLETPDMAGDGAEDFLENVGTIIAAYSGAAAPKGTKDEYSLTSRRPSVLILGFHTTSRLDDVEPTDSVAASERVRHGG